MKDWHEVPSRDGVYLWVCGDLLSPRLDEALGLVAPDEEERARAFRFEEDRRRYLGGTLLQRVVLSRLLSCSLGEVSFFKNEWGKPFLDKRHESTIQFSLSRSHKLSVLAVSVEGEIGVDVEYERGRVGNDLSMKSQFSEAEQEFIEQAADSRQAFFEIWARKEAYIKGIGRGLSHPLEKFDVSPSGEKFARDWSVDLMQETWEVRSMELSEKHYASALAMRGALPPVELIEVKINDLLNFTS